MIEESKGEEQTSLNLLQKETQGCVIPSHVVLRNPANCWKAKIPRRQMTVLMIAFIHKL